MVMMTSASVKCCVKYAVSWVVGLKRKTRLRFEAVAVYVGFLDDSRDAAGKDARSSFEEVGYQTWASVGVLCVGTEGVAWLGVPGVSNGLCFHAINVRNCAVGCMMSLTPLEASQVHNGRSLSFVLDA
jgi:hypothetical protein